MKRLLVIACVVLLSATINSNAQAEHNTTNGVIIGAGSGAILGQAIGRDTEATLIGTAVGGLFGYMIGNEMDHQGQRVVHHRTYQPPRTYSHTQKFGKPFAPNHIKKVRNTNKVCKKTIKIKERHGQTKRVVTKTCWSNNPYDNRYNNHRRGKKNRVKNSWDY